MRKHGAGRRWELIEAEAIQKHDLAQLRTRAAPLEQTFEGREQNPFTVRLTFLSPRPDLARVLANTFWIVHQDGHRKMTLITCTHCLRLFNRFLDYRMKSQPDDRFQGAVS